MAQTLVCEERSGAGAEANGEQPGPFRTSNCQPISRDSNPAQFGTGPGEAGEKQEGKAGPAAPAQRGEQSSELGSFRLDGQCSGNEPDPTGPGE